MRGQVWPFGLIAIIAGVFTGTMSVAGAVPAWTGGPSFGLTAVDPGGLHGLFLGALLIVLGWGLVRHRAVAWAVTVLLLGFMAVGIHHWRPSLFLVGGAVVLALVRSWFPVLPDRTRVRSAVRTGVIVLTVAAVFELAGRAGSVPHPGWKDAFLAVALVVLAALLRPAPQPAPSSDGERGWVRRLVGNTDGDTLAPFILRSDRTYLFSSDGTAALGYRVLLGVAVVGGDPVGDPRAFGDVVARFLDLCARRGWRPAALGARGELAEIWRANGLRTVCFGDEVLVDVAGFGLASRRMRNVRQAVARTRNAGVVTKIVRAGELPPALLAEMAELSARWLGRAAERGFSMILDGMFDDRHPEALFILAFDGDGRLVGFQRYLPCGDAALSLDSMRRERGRINGLNERMIVDVVEYARAHGIGTVSLNFAAFRVLVDRGVERGPVERAGYRALHLLDPLIQVESLYQFNAKFRPGYLPRHVVLDSWWALPVVLFALLGLEFALPYDLHRGRIPAVAPESPELPELPERLRPATWDTPRNAR